MVDEVLDKALDPGRCWIVKGPRGRFNHIGQHDQASFPGLRLGAGVSEIIDSYLIFSFQLFGFVIEISDKTGTVVLADGVDNNLSELVRFRDFDTFLDMGNQYQT